MLGIFHLAESSKWLEDKKDVIRNAGKDKPQRRGKAINATNTSMECYILLWFRNDCGVMAGTAHSNLGIHARLWRWCICWLELSGRSGQQLNQFERQKNALTVNPARAVNRKIGHWWLKSIGNSSAKSFHGKQFHDDMIIAKDKCFNVIDPWASIYNLLIPTKAVSQEFMAIDWSKKGGKQASDWMWTGCSFSFSSRRSECWAHGPRPRRPARLFVRLLRPALDMQTLDMHAHTCLNIFIF